MTERDHLSLALHRRESVKMVRQLTVTIAGKRGAGKTKLMQRLKQFLEFDGHDVRIDDGRLEWFLDRQIQGPLAEPVSIILKEEDYE